MSNVERGGRMGIIREVLSSRLSLWRPIILVGQQYLYPQRILNVFMQLMEQKQTRKVWFVMVQFDVDVSGIL